MNTEAIHSASFDPAFELEMIQLMFPQLEQDGRKLFLRLRAATLLLNRAIDADFSHTDAETRTQHDMFIREREARWMELLSEIRRSGLIDDFSSAQRELFHHDFSKVQFTAG